MRGRTGMLAAALAPLCVMIAPPAPAVAAPVTAPTIQQVSDEVAPATGFQNTTHVETDTFSWGSTVVSAFQVARSTDGFGAASIGFATSTDDGRTWTDGQLPGLTQSSPTPNSMYPRVVNQSVAYDLKHATWLIPSVTYVPSGTAFHEKALMFNTSSDGRIWNPAKTAVPTNVDKAWGVCDNTPTSPHYGTCYVAYSQLDSGYNLAVTSTSDGGSTWTGPAVVAVGGTKGWYNAFPVVRPDGHVVVVATDQALNGKNGSTLAAFGSSDGGASWSGPSVLATVQLHPMPPLLKLRAFNKPTADVDASGRITVVWADCRFQPSCAANDLVAASSSDGVTWGGPARLPLQLATGATDQFDPGVAIAPGTSGPTAQLSVVYYTTVACSTPPCVDARYSTSYDGGTTWSTPYTVNPAPMPSTWLASSRSGRMVGDYNSVSFVSGGAVSVLPIATAAPAPYAETEHALAMPPGWGTPTASPPPAPPPPAPAAPDTRIGKKPHKVVSTTAARVKVRFRFSATVSGSTFQCRLDKAPWRPCAGTAVYRVGAGAHRFWVRATSAGRTDASPAVYRFKVHRRQASRQEV